MSTSPQQSSRAEQHLTSLAQLAAKLHANSNDADLWRALDRTLDEVFGHALFTVLAFTKQSGATRLYSTNTNLHPLGTRNKSPPGNHERVPISNAPPPADRVAWVQQVLVDGQIWRGQVREDLKAAFEDWEQLWEADLGSVMNIPIRLSGSTIGSLNILDEEHRYDAAEFELGILVAQLVAAFVDRVANEAAKKKTM